MNEAYARIDKYNKDGSLIAKMNAFVVYYFIARDEEAGGIPINANKQLIALAQEINGIVQNIGKKFARVDLEKLVQDGFTQLMDGRKPSENFLDLEPCTAEEVFEAFKLLAADDIEKAIQVQMEETLTQQQNLFKNIMHPDTKEQSAKSQKDHLKANLTNLEKQEELRAAVLASQSKLHRLSKRIDTMREEHKSPTEIIRRNLEKTSREAETMNNESQQIIDDQKTALDIAVAKAEESLNSLLQELDVLQQKASVEQPSEYTQLDSAIEQNIEREQRWQELQQQKAALDERKAVKAQLNDTTKPTIAEQDALWQKLQAQKAALDQKNAKPATASPVSEETKNEPQRTPAYQENDVNAFLHEELDELEHPSHLYESEATAYDEQDILDFLKKDDQKADATPPQQMHAQELEPAAIQPAEPKAKANEPTPLQKVTQILENFHLKNTQQERTKVSVILQDLKSGLEAMTNDPSLNLNSATKASMNDLLTKCNRAADRTGPTQHFLKGQVGRLIDRIQKSDVMQELQEKAKPNIDANAEQVEHVQLRR